MSEPSEDFAEMVGIMLSNSRADGKSCWINLPRRMEKGVATEIGNGLNYRVWNVDLYASTRRMRESYLRGC